MGKKILCGIVAFLPHLLIAYGLMLLTFFGINIVNDSMAFLASDTSQHFELVYVTAVLLTVLAAFLQKQARIPAVIAGVCAVVLLIPVILAMHSHSRELLTGTAFPVIALISALATLVFAVMLIVLQRRAKREQAA